MDWKKEKEDLMQGKWWKPSTGQHKIKFLSNGEEFETIWEEKTLKKVRFDIEVAKEMYFWGVTKGITENSLYGQIVLLGENRGSLIDGEINLVVKGSGKDTSYVILEALPLMKVKEEAVK